MTPRLRGVLGSGVLALSLSGCVSNGQGEAMQAQLAEHETQIQQLHEARQAQIKRLEEAEKRAQASVQELERVIERATNVVTRNSADVTVTVAEMQEKVAELEGRIAELSFALDQARSEASSGGRGAAQAAPEPIPDDPGKHFDLAYAAFQAKEYERARSLFRAYVERHPRDGRADNAQYWIGASYLVERRPASALSELRKVIQQYRDGDAVDEALLDMSEAFYRLGACKDARDTLAVLIKSQRGSPLLKAAKAKQQQIAHAPPGKCKS